MEQDLVLSPYLVSLLQKLAQNMGMVNEIEIVPDSRTSHFEGYTSNVYFVTVKEPSTDKVLKLVAKLAITEVSTRFGYAIRENYSNECAFYKNLWPTLLKFQQNSTGSVFIDLVPKCYYSDPTPGKEVLILENLKAQGYVTFPRDDFYEREHLELMFKTYGEFHGLSFAYKCLSPTGFADFAATLIEVRVNSNPKLFLDQLKLAFDQCYEYCSNPTDQVLNQKLKKYCDNANIFFDVLNYKGEHSVFSHGDCWSNNMLFKYNEENTLTSLKLIDFQDMNTRSPVHDLSCNFYTGAVGSELPNLMYYLRKYHNSLCNVLEKFNMDGNLLYPFEVLREEWKIYCKFGFAMTLLLTKLKLAFEGEELALADIVESDQAPVDLEINRYDVDKVKLRYGEIVRHFYRYDYL